MPRKSTHTCVYWCPKSGPKPRCSCPWNSPQRYASVHAGQAAGDCHAVAQAAGQGLHQWRAIDGQAVTEHEHGTQVTAAGAQLLRQPGPGIARLAGLCHIGHRQHQAGVVEACHRHAQAAVVHRVAGNLARSRAAQQHRPRKGRSQVLQRRCVGAQLAGAEGQHQRLRAVQVRRQGALPALAGKVRGGGGLHRVSIRARWPGTGLPTPAYRQADRRA